MSTREESTAIPHRHVADAHRARPRPRGCSGVRRRVAGTLVAIVLALTAGAFGIAPSLRATLFPAAEAATATEAQVVAVGKPAPQVVFTAVDGRERRLSEFRGRPVMLWLFATWCPSCVSGTASVAGHFEALRTGGLQIIQLKLYKNLGYSGPSVEEIAKNNAGKAYPSPHWLFGDASKATSYLYDPKGVPDLYFLIDADGILRHVGWTPSATMDDILAFAQNAPPKSKSD